MESMTFRKATRSRAKLRLAIDGPSGSGKTYSALLLARGLVGPSGKIAMIDTERGSGELYSHTTDYDVLPLAPPYSPDRYCAAIRAAEVAGYDALIIDSLSHAWVGEGGVLDLHDKATAASRSGNSYSAWRDVTPKHNSLVDAMLGSPIHVIVTMRSKAEYVIEEKDGKKSVRKVWLAPVHREGMEYEFTTVLDLSLDRHIATASKDRTGQWDGRYEVPTIDMGQKMAAWLEAGGNGSGPTPAVKAAQKKADAQAPVEQSTPAHVSQLRARAIGFGIMGGDEEIVEFARHQGIACAGLYSLDPASVEKLLAAMYMQPTAEAHKEKREGDPMPTPGSDQAKRIRGIYTTATKAGMDVSEWKKIAALTDVGPGCRDAAKVDQLEKEVTAWIELYAKKGA